MSKRIDDVWRVLDLDDVTVEPVEAASGAMGEFLGMHAAVVGTRIAERLLAKGVVTVETAAQAIRTFDVDDAQDKPLLTQRIVCSYGLATALSTPSVMVARLSARGLYRVSSYSRGWLPRSEPNSMNIGPHRQHII